MSLDISILRGTHELRRLQDVTVPTDCGFTPQYYHDESGHTLLVPQS